MQVYWFSNLEGTLGEMKTTISPSLNYYFISEKYCSKTCRREAALKISGKHVEGKQLYSKDLWENMQKISGIYCSSPIVNYMFPNYVIFIQSMFWLRISKQK